MAKAQEQEVAGGWGLRTGSVSLISVFLGQGLGWSEVAASANTRALLEKCSSTVLRTLSLQCDNQRSCCNEMSTQMGAAKAR